MRCTMPLSQHHLPAAAHSASLNLCFCPFTPRDGASRTLPHESSWAASCHAMPAHLNCALRPGVCRLEALAARVVAMDRDREVNSARLCAHHPWAVSSSSLKAEGREMRGWPLCHRLRLGSRLTTSCLQRGRDSVSEAVVQQFAILKQHRTWPCSSAVFNSRPITTPTPAFALRQTGFCPIAQCLTSCAARCEHLQ